MAVRNSYAEQDVIMKLNNTYYLLRHGEALSNVDRFYSSWPEKINNPLTPQGVKMVEKAAEELKGKDIKFIFSSDLLRTKQTAEIIAKALSLEVNLDIRLRELDFGIFNGKPAEFFDNYFREETDRLEKSVPEGETYRQVAQRVTDFIKDIDEHHKGNILIVSHECPLWILKSIANEISLTDWAHREKVPYATIIELKN